MISNSYTIPTKAINSMRPKNLVCEAHITASDLAWHRYTRIATIRQNNDLLVDVLYLYISQSSIKVVHDDAFLQS